MHARFTEIAAIQAPRKFVDLNIYCSEEPTSCDRQETVDVINAHPNDLSAYPKIHKEGWEKRIGTNADNHQK